MQTHTHTTPCGHKIVGTLTEHGSAPISTTLGVAATLTELEDHLQRLGCTIYDQCAADAAWHIEDALLDPADDWADAIEAHEYAGA